MYSSLFLIVVSLLHLARVWPVAAFLGKCSSSFVGLEKDARTKPLPLMAIACLALAVDTCTARSLPTT